MCKYKELYLELITVVIEIYTSACGLKHILFFICQCVGNIQGKKITEIVNKKIVCLRSHGRSVNFYGDRN